MWVKLGVWGVVDHGLGVVASPCGVAGSARAVLGVFQWVRPLPMSGVAWWLVVWLVFVGGLGGIATIGAALRRVAGVSGVYGRKTPRAVARKGQGRVPVEGSMVLNLPCGCLKCSRPRWYAGDMGCLGCSGLRFGRGGWVDGGVMARLCAGGPFRWRCGRRQWPGATRMGLRRSMRLTSPPRAAPERDGVRSSRASSSLSISHV